MASAYFWLSLPADISALPSPGSATAEASLEGVSTAAMTPFGVGGKKASYHPRLRLGGAGAGCWPLRHGNGWKIPLATADHGSMVGVRGFEPPASTSRTLSPCGYFTGALRCFLICWDKFGTRDMGTITKRGELQWQAKVRRMGFPTQSRTFSYKEDAEKWVRAVDRELETSGFVDR